MAWHLMGDKREERPVKNRGETFCTFAFVHFCKSFWCHHSYMYLVYMYIYRYVLG